LVDLLRKPSIKRTREEDEALIDFYLRRIGPFKTNRRKEEEK